MPSGPSTLPLELSDISDDRREQLEFRRRREMARQEEEREARAGTGNFRWSPIAMIPAHLCVLIFLIFLLEKLEGSIDWPWAAVLSPLWITDTLFIVIKSKEVRQVMRTMVHLPSESYLLFPPVRGIIDHLGVAAAKVTLAYRLEDKVDWSLLLLFMPMWLCVILAGALRCITPPPPQVMGDQQMVLHRMGSFLTGLFHLIARGAQPMLIVLKVDGQVDGPWASVFIPLWMFMGAIAVGGFALCCCAPMVSRGVIPEIRPLLIRGMRLCSVGTFSLAFCALLFLVFLTLELDGNENMPPRTILAPLIALYAMILVFLPLLLLVTRHYVRTMRTAEEQFRQANDPNPVTETPAFGSVSGEGGAGGQEGFAPSGARGHRRARGRASMTPTILMRESSTLFRRASVSFCQRLGEANSVEGEQEIISFELWDWSLRRSSSRNSDGGVDVSTGGRGPRRSSRSFHDFLRYPPGTASRGDGGRNSRGSIGQRFTAAVAGTSGREQGRTRFAAPAERQRTGAEKEASPSQRGSEEIGSKASPEDERHDRALLPGDSGTHSVTDSYDLNSYGSYVDSDEENHEVGLSIDGDEDEEGKDEVGVGLRGSSSHSTASAAAVGAPGTAAAPAPPPPSTKTSTRPPEILLAFGSSHGAAAYSLHGGGGSGHGLSGNRWSVGRGGSSSRHGSSLHGPASGDIMPRRVSWPSGMSIADFGLDAGNGKGDTDGDDNCERDIEAGAGGGVVGGGAAVGTRTMCYICCERRADAVLMECGHGGMCFTCAQHLADTPPAQCPVCRHSIQEVLMFGGVVTLPSSGGSGKPLPSGGSAKTPDNHGPSSMGMSGIPPTPSSARTGGSSSSTPVRASAGPAPAPPRGGGALRRFAEPDVVAGGVSSVPAAGIATQGCGVVQPSRGEGGGGGSAEARRREASPPQTRDPTRRELEAQGLSEEGGWLDSV